MPPFLQASDYDSHCRIDGLVHFLAEPDAHLYRPWLYTDRDSFCRKPASPLGRRENVSHVDLVRRKLSREVDRQPLSLEDDHITGLCTGGDRVVLLDAIGILDEREERHPPRATVGKLDAVKRPLVAKARERNEPEAVIAHQWVPESDHRASAHFSFFGSECSAAGHGRAGTLLIS